MTAVQVEPWTVPASHPEEIRADFELRAGSLVHLRASARITPAGVICAGIAVATMTFAIGYLVSAARRP